MTGVTAGASLERLGYAESNVAIILVTVTASNRRVDLALPGDVPLARLVPGIARYFPDGRSPDAVPRILAPVGRSPFPHDRSLAECGVVDGATIELRQAAPGDSPPGTGARMPDPFGGVTDAVRVMDAPPASTPSPEVPRAPVSLPANEPPPLPDEEMYMHDPEPPVPGRYPGSGGSDTPPPTQPSQSSGPINWPPDPGADPSSDADAETQWNWQEAAYDESGDPLRELPPQRPPARRPGGGREMMRELSDSMATPTAAAHRVRAGGRSAGGAKTTLSTSIAFLVVAMAAAGYVINYGITVRGQLVQTLLFTLLGFVLVLYYGGLKYRLLEPLLERVPRGEALIALGGTGTAAGSRRPLSDTQVAERLQRLGVVVEDFLYDLALLLAGHDPALDYVEHDAAQRLRAKVAPFLLSGQRLTPNFGQHGDMKVRWDPDDDRDPVYAEVQFDDLSTRETDSGERVVVGRRRILVTLTLDPTVSHVIDVDLQPAPTQNHAAPAGA